MNITWIETVSKTWSREEKIFHFDVGVRREKLLTAKSISHLKCFWFQWFMIPARKVYSRARQCFLSYSPNSTLHVQSIMCYGRLHSNLVKNWFISFWVMVAKGLIYSSWSFPSAFISWKIFVEFGSWVKTESLTQKKLEKQIICAQRRP